MKVSAEQVRSSPGRRLRLQVDEPVPSGAEDVPFVAPVRGEVEMCALGGRLRLRGRFSTEAELACGRCLRGFRAELAAEVDEWYDPELGPTEEVPVEDGVLVMPLTDPEVDVTEVARQHLLLALPSVPLCRPDCAGLCPHCGADRNTDPCTCAARPVDPRWQILQNVLGGLP
ncbi:MAG: DUF177 domain-containing protein [Armatimonadota bacterium]|nr:DUF177 domain-containing protein [Armatimonadota bacterium]MDW8155124.1 DUF177 domain-containing protein [Armatimonadota bacterium]